MNWEVLVVRHLLALERSTLVLLRLKRLCLAHVILTVLPDYHGLWETTRTSMVIDQTLDLILDRVMDLLLTLTLEVKRLRQDLRLMMWIVKLLLWLKLTTCQLVIWVLSTEKLALLCTLMGSTHYSSVWVILCCCAHKDRWLSLLLRTSHELCRLTVRYLSTFDHLARLWWIYDLLPCQVK